MNPFSSHAGNPNGFIHPTIPSSSSGSSYTQVQVQAQAQSRTDNEHHARTNATSGSSAPRKNRKLNRSATQLKRNSACIPCRRRRIKCDAGKPHCSSCLRSHQFLLRTQPDKAKDVKIGCFYEDDVDADADEGDGEGEGEEYSHTPEEVEEEDTHGHGHGHDHGHGHGSSGRRRSSNVEFAQGRKRKSVDVHVDDHHVLGHDNGKNQTVEQLEARVAELQQALLATAATTQSGGSSVSSGPGTAPDYIGLNAAPLPGPVGANPSGVNASWSASTYTDNNNGNGMTSTSMSFQTTTDIPYIPPTTPSGMDLQALLNPTKSLMMSGNGYTAPVAPTSMEITQSGSIFTQVKIEEVLEGSAVMGANMADDGNLDREAGKLGGPFLELFWPGWPPTLPTPALVEHLVHVFFTMVPSISRLLHYPKFTARLLLPPNHPDFPHPALLHAICAVSARYSAAVKISSVDECIAQTDEEQKLGRKPVGQGYIEDEIAGISCFAERNFRYALLQARPEGMLGRKLLEVVQAMVIMQYYCQQHAKWITGYTLSGYALRMAMPVNLMRDPYTELNSHNAGQIMQLVPEATEDWDREERRALTFVIFLFDAYMSSSSGWPTGIMLDELYTHLPCSRADFERGGKMKRNPQTLQSPDLLTKHPVEDSFVLCIKGAYLTSRVNKFCRKVKAALPPDRMPMRDTLEFAQLDNDIATYSHHFPSSLRDPLKPLTGLHKGIDADLITAHFMPHLLTIYLHEPFADLSDTSNVSAMRLAAASRACLSIIHNVFNTSTDLSYSLVPITSCEFPWDPVDYSADQLDCCFTAARTLCLFYQRALELGDTASSRMILCEIDIFRLASQALAVRFAMGIRTWGMIEAMLRRIDAEYGGSSALVVMSIFPVNTPQRTMPKGHPDSVLNAVHDRSTSFREIMDRRRGYSSRHGSTSSYSSPNDPSPGGGSGSGTSGAIGQARLSPIIAPTDQRNEAGMQSSPDRRRASQGMTTGAVTAAYGAPNNPMNTSVNTNTIPGQHRPHTRPQPSIAQMATATFGNGFGSQPQLNTFGQPEYNLMGGFGTFGSPDGRGGSNPANGADQSGGSGVSYAAGMGSVGGSAGIAKGVGTTGTYQEGTGGDLGGGQGANFGTGSFGGITTGFWDQYTNQSVGHGLGQSLEQPQGQGQAQGQGQGEGLSQGVGLGQTDQSGGTGTGGIGFDWLNWAGTANITILSPEEGNVAGNGTGVGSGSGAGTGNGIGGP